MAANFEQNGKLSFDQLVEKQFCNIFQRKLAEYEQDKTTSTEGQVRVYKLPLSGKTRAFLLERKFNQPQYADPINGNGVGIGSPLTMAIYYGEYKAAEEILSSKEFKEIENIQTGSSLSLLWHVERIHPELGPKGVWNDRLRRTVINSKEEASVLALAVSKLTTMCDLGRNIEFQTQIQTKILYPFASKFVDAFDRWKTWQFPGLFPPFTADEELYTLIEHLIEKCPADKLPKFIQSVFRGTNVVYDAMLYGDERLVRLLLGSLKKKGLDINKDILPTPNGGNLFIDAARFLQPNMVRLLIEQGADVNVKEFVSSNYRTAHMMAQYYPNLNRDRFTIGGAGCSKQREVLGVLEGAQAKAQAGAQAETPGRKGCLRRWTSPWSSMSPHSSAISQTAQTASASKSSSVTATATTTASASSSVNVKIMKP